MYFKKKDYELLTVCRWNAFFVVKEEFHKFNLKSISKEEMLNKYCIFEKYWCNRNIYEVPPYDWIHVE